MKTQSEIICEELDRKAMRDRFTIVRTFSGRFRVWDNQHNVERGLFRTVAGAERRVWELENAESIWAGKRRKAKTK